MSTLSTRPAVPQSVGLFGMVSWNVPAHGVFGARVEPALMTVPPATVQLMFTTVPPGNGLVSVSAVTSAGLSPVFETMKTQVMVWPIVADVSRTVLERLRAGARIWHLGLRRIPIDESSDHGNKRRT